MPWLRRFSLFLAFVTALFRPAAAGVFTSSTPANGQARVGADELVAATLIGPASGATCGLHEGIGAAYDANASGYRFAARGVSSLESGRHADRGGLTAAGRALQKHGGRPGSAFPAARGNPRQINEAGQGIVDDILTSPGSTTTTRHHARFGDVTEIRAPDGRGVRYDANGGFIGFLEP